MAQAAPRPSGIARFLLTGFKLALYLGIVAAIALAVAVAVAVGRLPSYGELIRRDDLGQMIRVRSADGRVIHAMGPSFGEWLTHDEIPPIMREAMLAVEDRRFRNHPGIDPLGMARALKVRVDRGRWTQGGSTITQQLARNIFLDNTRTFDRKLREAILALALEWRFSKDQILELYLNRVYFGGGAYGIDAASRKFFGHSATELTIPQAAIIAGLVKAPSNYSPTADADAARDRAEVVIGLMVDNGTITRAQAAASDPNDVELVRTPERSHSARYFVDWVLPQLDMLIDETVQPIDVWTTIDLDMQAAAHSAINAATPRGAQGALVSLDRDGAVRAMVGGRNYVDSLYNRATQAERQPGSAFKLFVYLAALESGLRPDSLVQDSPVTVAGWSPRNDSGRFSGNLSLAAAFAYSVNTVAVKLAQEVGTRTVADMAQRLGITSRVATNPSMALGTSEVRVIDMTRAYASVARGGVAVVPYGIRRVTTSDGTLLFQHQDDESRVLVAPHVAAQMTDLLQGVVVQGTGRGAALGRPTAGKTGTTSSNKDGWFVGFSSGLTTGVWMGRDDNRVVAGLAGGRAPARAFHDYMLRAVADRPAEPFNTDVAVPDTQLEGDPEVWFSPPASEQDWADEPGPPPSEFDPIPPPPGRNEGPSEFDALPPGFGRGPPPRREPSVRREPRPYPYRPNRPLDRREQELIDPELERAPGDEIEI